MKEFDILSCKMYVDDETTRLLFCFSCNKGKGKVLVQQPENVDTIVYDVLLRRTWVNHFSTFGNEHLMAFFNVRGLVLHLEEQTCFRPELKRIDSTISRYYYRLLFNDFNH
jgi:hypothetical protein